MAALVQGQSAAHNPWSAYIPTTQSVPADPKTKPTPGPTAARFDELEKSMAKKLEGMIDEKIAALEGKISTIDKQSQQQATACTSRLEQIENQMSANTTTIGQLDQRIQSNHEQMLSQMREMFKAFTPTDDSAKRRKSEPTAAAPTNGAWAHNQFAQFFSHCHCGPPFGALDFAPHPVVFWLLVFMFTSCLFFPGSILGDATPSRSIFRQCRSPRFEQQSFDSEGAKSFRYLRPLNCFSCNLVTCTIAGHRHVFDMTSSCIFEPILAAPSYHQFFIPFSPQTSHVVRGGASLNSIDDSRMSIIFCHLRPSHIPWDKIHRIGEATNPGPSFPIDDAVQIPHDAFQFGVINPTGLHQKAELVASLGKGVWAVAESRVTHKSRSLLRHEFKSFHFNTDFSDPVPPCSKKRSDVYRGIAAGVACISAFPIRNVSYDIPQHIRDSFRLIASHVSLGPHTILLVITISKRLVVGCGVCTFGDPLNLQLVKIVQSRTHNSTV